MDKELALIIAELLIKQDETTDQVRDVTTQLKETNSILKEFMGVSVKQWQQQHIFNELLIKEVKEIKKEVSALVQLDARVKAIEERENQFESRLTNVEKLLKAS